MQFIQNGAGELHGTSHQLAVLDKERKRCGTDRCLHATSLLDRQERITLGHSS